MSAPRDDLGDDVPLDTPPRRVVSLVPSLTEAIAVSAPGVLVGATQWCVRPEDLRAVRVRGTKNPDLGTIVELHPDLVVANEEENRKEDVAALRAAGLPVWVTDIRTVDGALASLARLLEVLEAPDRKWLARAADDWAGVAPVAAYRVQAAVAVWRKPWMWVGRDTYAGDVLARLGVDNVLSGHDERYPRIAPPDLPARDLLVLPDEPYRFTEQDAREAFPDTPCALVDGQSLTWYGPRMLEAPAPLRTALAAALAR